MPVRIPGGSPRRLNRREFLGTGATVLAGWLLFRPSVAADPAEVDPNYFVLLADTHIDGDPERISWGINMAGNLEETVRRILKARPRPAGVVINGDAAFAAGYKEDYRVVRRLLSPLSEAGIPVYITMGNHDDRGPFREILPDGSTPEPGVDDRHIAVVETPHARFFLLDSLKNVNETPGRLGREQREWLEEALDEYNDKPAILFGHHHYHLWDGTPGRGGLQDTKELWEMIVPRGHVKAYIHGHLHIWRLAKTDGIHRVCQPCTSYTFDRDDRTQAFLHARFYPERLELEVECLLQPDFPWHGERHTLSYRAG